MTPRFASVLCLALGLAASAAHASSDDAALRDRLVRLTGELMDAIPVGKAEVWQRILADDAVVIDEFGRRQDKKEAVAAIHAFPPGLSGSIEIRDPHVQARGDSAVLSGEMYERETVFGQQLVVRYIFGNTFVRRGDDWQLLAAIDVTLPTQPPSLDVPSLRLSDYVGSYRYGPHSAYAVQADGDHLFYTTHAGGARTKLDAVAKDVFMSEGDERNLLVFRRDGDGAIIELIERRKFNDLHLAREASTH